MVRRKEKRKDDKRPPEEIPLEERADDIVYSPVPPDHDGEWTPKSEFPPEAPEFTRPRLEREISKKGEERIAKEQADEGDEEEE